MASFNQDPDATIDVFCVSTQNIVAGASTSPTLPNGKRVEIGNYDHVVLIVAHGGGSGAGTITLVPRESDSQTGAEFPLDGTNGAPDLSMSFAGGTISSGNASRQRTIRVAGRRQFLNLVVGVPAATTFRPIVYILGIGKRANTGKLVNTDSLHIGPMA